MPTCVPVKALRDTAAFVELVRAAPEPVTVTKNGYDEFMCVRSADYRQLDPPQVSVAQRPIIR